MCFFRRTRPREVSLFFSDDILPYMLSNDLLLALSYGGRLESLTLTCLAANRYKYSVEEIKAVDL
jgi:D-arabinose 5-phosphate isomerase GutQ